MNHNKKTRKPTKLFIFLSALIACLIIGVSITYILEYNKNIPYLFDENIKATKFKDLDDSKYFDFTVRSVVYTPKKSDSTKNGSFEVDATLFLKDNINSENISSVKIQYSTGCNWGKCIDKSTDKSISASYYIRDESKDISKQTTSTSFSFTTIMPLKPMLFINIKIPDIYVKLTYNIKSSVDETSNTKKEYFKLGASEWKNLFNENF